MLIHLHWDHLVGHQIILYDSAEINNICLQQTSHHWLIFLFHLLQCNGRNSWLRCSWKLSHRLTDSMSEELPQMRKWCYHQVRNVKTRNVHFVLLISQTEIFLLLYHHHTIPSSQSTDSLTIWEKEILRNIMQWEFHNERMNDSSDWLSCLKASVGRPVPCRAVFSIQCQCLIWGIARPALLWHKGAHNRFFFVHGSHPYAIKYQQ